MAIEIQPVDSWFTDCVINLNTSKLRVFSIPNVTERILIAKSIYEIKSTNLVEIKFNKIHTPWLHACVDMDVLYIGGTLTYRKYVQDIGYKTSLSIPNPKKYTYATNVSTNLSINTSTSVNETIPLCTYGSILNNPDDTVYTQFSAVTHPSVKITAISLVEYDIEVYETLTENVFVQVSAGNPFNTNGTVYGKTCSESTLPEGAIAGIVGMKLEAKLDAELGSWIIQDTNKRNSMLKSSESIYTNNYSVQTRSDDAQYYRPKWYTDALENKQIKNSDVYIAYESNIEQPYYACGLKIHKTTFGNGLFVSEINKVKILPWDAVESGILSVDRIQNKYNVTSNTYKSTIPMLDIFNANEWKTQFIEYITTALCIIPDSFWLPVAATSLQILTSTPDITRSIHNVSMLYPWKLQDNKKNIQVTPLYTTNAYKSVYYTPAPTYNGATRVHNINVTSLTQNLDLCLYTSQDDITIHNAPVPRKIKDSPGLFKVSTSRVTENYDVDVKGFEVYTSQITRGNSYYGDYGSYYTIYTHSYSTTMKWVNPTPIPTVGSDSSTSQYTCIPVIAGHIMMFIALLPSGTPPGTYKYKPFNNFVVIPTPLNCHNLKYTPIAIESTSNIESTHVPYIGTNIVTVQIVAYSWTYNIMVDNPQLPAHTVIQTLLNTEPTINSLPTTTTMVFRLILETEEVPLIGYPTVEHPVLVEVNNYPDISECAMPDSVQTAPFRWVWYEKQENTVQHVVAIAEPTTSTIYIVSVELGINNTITKYKEVLKTIEFRNTPFGDIVKILGMCHTTDIQYITKKEVDMLCIYCMVDEYLDDTDTTLVVLILRDDFEWDTHKDTVIKIPVLSPDGRFKKISINEKWPKGIAVLYPYVYVLGYMYIHENVKTPSYTISGVEKIRGSGWQECLICVDILAGTPSTQARIQDAASLRFTHGIPAIDRVYRQLHFTDTYDIGKYNRYMWGATQQYTLPSSEIPMEGTNDYPTLAGLCAISGQLLAIHNGLSKPVLINPVSVCVETSGFSIFPFVTPFNGNIVTAYDNLYSTYIMQGRLATSCHPFLHLCLGDNLFESEYTTGIDIQDVSYGTEVIRKVKIRNNLLRDILTGIELSVPDETILQYSEMMFLSLSSEGPWTKSIIIPSRVVPCETQDFFIRVSPHMEVLEPVTLYLNAKFSRTTSLFGYRL